MATFDDVYRQHLPAVLRAAWRAVGRRDIAEELTADAFLELYRQFDKIDTALLPGWLLTVVRHRAVDHWRRQQVERKYVESAFESPASGAAPELPSVPADLFSHAALKPIHRTCLLLRYAQGLSRADIALRLGLSETQVRGHLQYGLTLLRQNLVLKRA